MGNFYILILQPSVFDVFVAASHWGMHHKLLLWNVYGMFEFSNNCLFLLFGYQAKTSKST